MFDFDLTGVVANAVRLANALAERGHEVAMLVCRDAGREHHRLDPRIEILVEADPTGKEPARALALLRAIPGIRRRLRAIRPDILLSAGNHGHLPVLAASWRLAGLQRVLRISNEPDHPGDGVLLRLLRNLLLRLVTHLADRLLLVSPRLARHRALSAACEEGRATVAANGVAADRIRRLAAERCDHPWAVRDVPLVVAVGRLARQKNFATLLRAVALANRRRPVNLLVVGRGSAAARLKLVGLAERLGIGGRVDFLGERGNPFPYMRAASVFVLPSLWEGRSNVLLEAMACGVPIVASRTAGDAEELLGYGRFGLLVDPMDAEGMAAAMLLQTGPDVCRPEQRVDAFDEREAVARVCAALTGMAVPAE